MFTAPSPHGRVLLAAVTVALCAAPAFPADKAEDVFESLYGKDYRQALASRDRQDDLDLAGRLLDAAEDSKDHADLMAVLLDRCWTLAAKGADGLKFFQDSRPLLDKVPPAGRPAVQDRYLAVLEDLYDSCKLAERHEPGEELLTAYSQRVDACEQANDLEAALTYMAKAVKLATTNRSLRLEALQTRQRDLAARRRALLQAAKLRKAIEDDPTDRASREKLIELYVVDLDDPSAAGELLTVDCGETLRTYVPLAAGSPNALAEPVCLELARWYEGFARGDAELAMLLRVRTYYRQYLKKHGAADLEGKKIQLLLKDVQDRVIKLCPTQGFGKPEFSDPKLRAAFDKALAFLRNAQRDDGSWREYFGADDGATAIVVLAMLEAGVSPQEPRLAKALAWLGRQQSMRTILIGVRSRACMLAERAAPGQTATVLRRDAQLLLTSTKTGCFSYECQPKYPTTTYGDNYCSHFGLLGILAAAEAGLDVPGGFWKTAGQYWAKGQKPDGSWSYRSRDSESRASSTAAGLFAAAACMRQLGSKSDDILKTAQLQKAMDWLAERHADSLQGDQRMYYLYSLASFGQIVGSTKIGKVDWYDDSIPWLLKQQRPDGSWYGGEGLEVDTAMAVLFLTYGQRLQPIVPE